MLQYIRKKREDSKKKKKITVPLHKSLYTLCCE